MSYVKYREDDIKIANHRMHLRQGSIMRPAKSEIRYYECVYCHLLFTSKLDLFSHIRDVHNIVRPLIVINDKVVGDYTVLQYVQNAKILMYGFDGDIIIGGTSLQYGDVDEIDITDMLKCELSVHTCCQISFNDVCVSVELHPLSIDDNSLIKSTIIDWQHSVSLGLSPNPALLSEFAGGDLLFLQGIYNYYLACTVKHHKARRYDDAFSALSQFNGLGGIGKCVLKAIAFRRNWIDTLRLLDDGEQDVFSTACEYFNWEESSFNYEKEESANKLFVEEGTMLSLELIVLFQKGMHEKLKSKISELGDIDDLGDMNLIEQLYLLKARIAAAEGNKSLSKRYYERLNTPAFRKEYQRFL